MLKDGKDRLNSRQEAHKRKAEERRGKRLRTWLEVRSVVLDSLELIHPQLPVVYVTYHYEPSLMRGQRTGGGGEEEEEEDTKKIEYKHIILTKRQCKAIVTEGDRRRYQHLISQKQQEEFWNKVTTVR